MMDPITRKDVVVAYPLLGKPFEKSLLGKLGIGPEQLVDTRRVDVRPTADGMIYCTNETTMNWMDCISHPADYTLTRNRFEVNQQRVPETRRRLYLRRNPAYRRAFTNEEEVCGLLRKYRFEVLELGALSSEEQIRLCSEASILFGIHGADLSNMLWCSPGATVIEIFGRGFRPNFYRAMAHGLGLNYLHWAEVPYLESSYSNLNMNVTMDVQLLENYLNKIDIETNQPSAL
jgi:capsular polysaccharide biosynthesis protein